MKDPTARRPLVLNPSKDPPLIWIVNDGAIAVGFTQKMETTLEAVHSAIDAVLHQCTAICQSTQ